MRLLLDTHALLWFASGNPRLNTIARAAVTDPANDVLISAVSLWEIAIKVRGGKLDADVTGIATNSVREGFRIVDISAPHVARLMSLPSVKGHRDPFDHMLLAQAAAEGATFVSADARLGRYGVPLLNCG